MKGSKWQIASGPGDFLPILIGCVLVFITVPPFVMLLVSPDPDSGSIRDPLLVIHAVGIAFGLGFLVLGVQLLAAPGSLVYRLAHGRFFRR